VIESKRVLSIWCSRARYALPNTGTWWNLAFTCRARRVRVSMGIARVSHIHSTAVTIRFLLCVTRRRRFPYRE